MVQVNLLPPSHLTALLVEDVLASYPLNPRRASRIRDLTLRRFRDKPDLETIYLFIDSMVEGGVQPEDFLRSVRAPDSLPSPVPEPLFELLQRERGPRITFGRIVSLVTRALGERRASALVEVLDRARVSPEAESPVTEQELRENMEAVAERLLRLRDRLDRCGVLALPRRVGRVSFGRINLFEYVGAYVSMVTDAEAVRIFEAHRSGLSQTEAAGFSGVSRETVKRWWSSAGLKPHHREHNTLPAKLIERIREAHRTFDGNAAPASRALGVAPSTVIRHWRRAGLAPSGRPPALDDTDRDRLVNAHAEHRGNASAASRALDLAPSTVRKYWKLAGLTPRPPGRPRKAKSQPPNPKSQ